MMLMTSKDLLIIHVFSCFACIVILKDYVRISEYSSVLSITLTVMILSFRTDLPGQTV